MFVTRYKYTTKILHTKFFVQFFYIFLTIMEKEIKIRLFEEAFEQAKRDGRVRNLNEFAELVGMSRPGLSAARNGNEKYLTDSLINRVRGAVYGYGEQTPPDSILNDSATEAPGIFLPGSTLKLYEAIVESNKELSSTVKTQQDTIRMLVEIIREDNGVKKGPSADLPGDMIRNTP